MASVPVHYSWAAWADNSDVVKREENFLVCAQLTEKPSPLTQLQTLNLKKTYTQTINKQKLSISLYVSTVERIPLVRPFYKNNWELKTWAQPLYISYRWYTKLPKSLQANMLLHKGRYSTGMISRQH